jgi:hypothetical protein
MDMAPKKGPDGHSSKVSHAVHPGVSLIKLFLPYENNFFPTQFHNNENPSHASNSIAFILSYVGDKGTSHGSLYGYPTWVS